MAEAPDYVQVATDGTGKKVRNKKVTEQTGVDTSGNAQADTVTYAQQVQVIGDDAGLADWSDLKVIANHLERQNELLELILAALS